MDKIERSILGSVIIIGMVSVIAISTIGVPTATDQAEVTMTESPTSPEEAASMYYAALATGDKEQALAVTGGSLHAEMESNFSSHSLSWGARNATITGIGVPQVSNPKDNRVGVAIKINSKSKNRRVHRVTSTTVTENKTNTPKVHQDPTTQHDNYDFGKNSE